METIRVLIPEEKVDERIRELGQKISKDYAGRQVHLICVLKGGVFFMCELAKRITVPVTMDFMCVGSYGDGTKSSGVVRIAKDLDETIEDKEVLIVEDIVDSGNTIDIRIADGRPEEKESGKHTAVHASGQTGAPREGCEGGLLRL